MRTVALEEHFNIPFLVERIPVEAIRRRGFPPRDQMSSETARPQATLKELGDVRLKDMDEAGISMQVLSIAGPGADLLPAEQSVPWAREANDYLAQAISAHPDRYAGLRIYL